MNLKSLSIIPHDALKSNPTTIPFHNPSFPLVRYNKIVTEHFFWKHVQLAEEMAKMNDNILIPSSCMNWRRKQQYQDRIIIISGKSFYVMKPADLTKKEVEKLKEHVETIA